MRPCRFRGPDRPSSGTRPDARRTTVDKEFPHHARPERPHPRATKIDLGSPELGTEMVPKTKHRIVTWDTADDVTQLVDELNEAIAAVFNDRQCPRIAAVDTASDMLAVVVSPADITDAQTIWDDAMAEVGR